MRAALGILLFVRTFRLSFLLVAIPVLITGCKQEAPADSAAARLEHAQQIDAARQDLQNIPPPSKHLYLNVQRMEDWQNPWLTVQEKMISVHVLMADANPSDLGKGTMLRPQAARVQVLNVDPKNIAEALNAIPRDAWPYGRVVAIEEAHDAPQAARPALRRNIETAIDTLSTIGVVADEWADNRPVGSR